MFGLKWKVGVVACAALVAVGLPLYAKKKKKGASTQVYALGQTKLLSAGINKGFDPQSPTAWSKARPVYLFADQPGKEVEARFDVVFDPQDKQPLAVRAFVLSQETPKLKIDWQAAASNEKKGAVQVSLLVASGRGKRQKAQQLDRVVAYDDVTPYAKYRDGDFYVLNDALMWRCPDGAVRLCRDMIMTLSYQDLPLGLDVKLLPGMTSEKQAFAYARKVLKADDFLGQFKQKKKPRRSKFGIVVAMETPKALKSRTVVDAWSIVRKVGQHWLMCTVRPSVDVVGVDKKQAKSWFARARKLCKRLEPTPGFANQPDCKAQLDVCVSRCGKGAGARCRDVAQIFKSRQDDTKYSTYLDMGCRHQDAESCRLLSQLPVSHPKKKQYDAGVYVARACALRDTLACATLGADTSRSSQVRMDALKLACAQGHAQSCARRAPLVASSAQRVALKKRACALGHLPSCQ